MKQALHLWWAPLAAVAAFFMPLRVVHAQQTQIYCIAGSLTPCITASQQGNGTQGDPEWKSFGKINTMFAQLYAMFGGASNLFTTGTVSAADVISRFGGCSGTLALSADGNCHSAGAGSVTSIALTVPSGCSVSGSPITSSGTLAITCASGLATSAGGTGATSLAAAQIPTWAGSTPVAGDCVKWNTTTQQGDAGFACGTGGTGGGQFVAEAANFTLTASINSVLCNAAGGAITITVPNAVSSSTEYTVKKSDSSANTCTVNTAIGGQTIDGASTQVLQFQYTSITMKSDNTNWWIK